MHQFSIFRKILLMVVVASMLSLPLAGIGEDYAVSSGEEATPEFSLMVNDGGVTEDYLLRSEPELSFNVDLVPAEGLCFPGDSLQLTAKPAFAVLPLKDLISKIFIPPKIVS